MSTPNHLITDFNFKKPNTTISYWVFKYLGNKSSKPSFLDDSYITNSNISYSNSCTWVNFLKNNFLPQGTKNKLDLTVVKHSTYQGVNDPYYINNSININFLRSERLYTKLKYSRSPAYDIVSGGAAALFAGFLGFLISEKFGFELVDSGDFYYLFMYIVFLVFIIKPFLYISSVDNNPFTSLSIKNFLNFYTKLLILTLTLFKI